VAKIQAYKFVNPGSLKTKSPVALAVRKQTLATNNLGKTLQGITTVVSDIEKISIGMVENEKLRERIERRRAQRARDQAAEDRLEEGLVKDEGKKSLSSALKRQGKSAFQKGFGWLTGLLSPIASFLAKIGVFAITSEVLKYIGDEKNRQKLATFVEKALFVFEKLYGWASGFTQNILDGYTEMFAEDGDFGSRLRGLGNMMKGIIGLKYLMNPFSLITDILDLLDLFDRQKPEKPLRTRPKGTTPDGKPKPKPKKPRTGPFGFLDDLIKRTGDRISQSKFNPFKDNRTRLDKYYDDALGIKPTALDNLKANTVNTATAIAEGVKDKAKKLKTSVKPVTDTVASVVDNTLTSVGLDKTTRTEIAEKASKKLTSSLDKGKSILGGLFRNLTFAEGSASRSIAVRAGQELTFAEGSTTRKAANFVGDQGKRLRNALGNQFNKFSGWANSLPDKARNALVERILKPVMSSLEPIINTVKGVGGVIQKNFLKLPFIPKILEALKKKGVKGFTDVKGALSQIGPYAWPIIGGLFSLISSYDRLTNADPTGAVFDLASGAFDLSVLGGFAPGAGISTFLDIALLGRDLAGVFFPEFDPRTEEDKFINTIGLGGLQGSIKAFGSKLPKLSELSKIFGDAQENGPNRDDFPTGRTGTKQYQEARDKWLETKDQPMFLGGIVKGISKAVSGIGKVVSKVVNNPIVSTAAMFIPGAGPIIAGVRAGAALASGNPMGAVMAGVSMIPGMGGAFDAIGGVMSKVGGFINSPLGQVGTSLLQGDFMGAASIGLGMIGGPIGSLGQQILGGNISGAISSGLGMISPVMGELASSVLAGGFQPMNILTNVADHFGLSGVMSAITGAMGGDMTQAINLIGSEIGIDPKILGAVDNVTTKAMSKDGLSAKYAMEQALDFVPIPLVLEKLTPIMQAVPINKTTTQVVQATESSLANM